MSSMEVDGTTSLNGLQSSLGARKSVRFDTTIGASARVTVFPKTIEVRPKHKARRRARQPKPEDQAVDGAIPTKPLSPSKLKKVAEKDRHSRTGVRGLPKKGTF